MNEMKVEFELQHFKCRDVFYIVYNGSLSAFSKNNFITCYQNKWIDEENRFITKWLDDPDIREYNKIDYGYKNTDSEHTTQRH